MRTISLRKTLPLALFLLYPHPCNQAGARAETPLKLTTRFSYDANGNLAARTDANGATTRYEYDAFERLLAIRYRDDSAVTFKYDALGQCIEMSEGLGATAYEYDLFGRLARVRDANGYTLRYEYDGRGFLAKLFYPQGNFAAYTWNANGQPSAIADETGETRYEYNLANNLIRRTLPNGITTQYSYDEANRLAAIRHMSAAGELLLGFEYAYDALDRRIQMTRTQKARQAQITRYEYDALSRLIKIAYPDGETATYEYDALGNRLAMASSQHGSTRYFYNRLGQLTALQSPRGKETFRYDANGNLIERQKNSGKPVKYKWDAENRLLEVARDTAVVSFRYDGEGRRLQKIFNRRVTKYAQHGSQLSQVVLADAEGQITQTLPGMPHIGEAGKHGVLCYLEDGLGSVVGVTDASGNLIHTREYDAFGALRSADTLATAFGFTGEQFDEETGLLFLRARYYDPALGRFISADTYPPAPENPQTFNQYAYAGNNPVNFTDPFGLYWWPPFFQWWRNAYNFLPSFTPQAGQEALRFYTDLWVKSDPTTLSGFGARTFAGTFGFFAALWTPDTWKSTALTLSGGYGIGSALGYTTLGQQALIQGTMLGSRSEPFHLPLIGRFMHYGVNKWGPHIGLGLERKAWLHLYPTHINIGGRSGINLAGSLYPMLPVMGDMAKSWFSSQTSTSRENINEIDQIDFGSKQQYYPPFPPGGGGGSALGGVALDRAAKVLVDLEDLVGARYDPASGQIILLGCKSKNLALPRMNMDDLVVAFRAIYSGQEPSMSIEPCTPGLQDGCMKVHYNGRFQIPSHPEWGWVQFNESGQLAQTEAPVTFGTHFGWVMFEADRYLKTATLGWDNLSPEQRFNTNVPGFVSELERLSAQYASQPHLARNDERNCRIDSAKDRNKPSTCHRLWFVPDSMIVKISSDGHTLAFEPVKILTQARFVRFDSSGQMVDVPGQSPSVEQFVEHLNAHYSEFAKEKKELAELVQLAKIVGLVRWLHDKNIPVDMSWVDRYQVAAFDSTPTTTPGIEAISGAAKIYGGVEMPRANAYRLAPPEQIQPVAEALSHRIARSEISWQFPGGGDTLTAVAVNLAPAKIVGGFSFARTDAFVTLSEELAAEFTLRYNSLDPAPGPFGRGWTHEAPSLTFRNLASPDGPRAFYTQAELRFGARVTTFRLSDDDAFHPEDFASPYYALGLTGENAFAPAGVPGLHFVARGASRAFQFKNKDGARVGFQGFAVLHKDGTIWAFDNTGRFLGVRTPAGGQLHYAYQGELLTAMSHAEGRGIFLSYDANDRLALLKTSKGREVRYAYDQRDNLIRLADETGTTLADYVYDVAGRLSAIKNGFGQIVLENTYDDLGRVIATRDAGGFSRNTTFDDRNNSVAEQDALGNRVTRGYDQRNRLARLTDPAGRSTRLEYDENGRLAKIFEAEDRFTRIEYEPRGFVSTVTSSSGQQWHWLNHNDMGRPQATISPAQLLTLYRYDGRGRLTGIESGFKVTSALAQGQLSYAPVQPYQLQYEYDAAGRLTAARDAERNLTRYVYDDEGRLTATQLPGGGEIKQTYDARGRLDSVADPLGRTLKVRRDDFGRVTTLTTPAGSTKYEYAGEQLKSVTDPLQHTTVFEYNPTGLLAKTTEPHGAATAFEYDLAGNLVAVADALGGRIAYEYDAMGRLLAMTRSE